MRLRTLFLTAAAFAAVPVLSLIILVVIGATAAKAALIAMAASIIAAFCLGYFWLRGTEIIVRSLNFEGKPGLRYSGSHPVLPPLGRIRAATERLARSFAEEKARLERLRLADEVILDKLPDPLIVLRRDLRVQSTNAAARAIFGDDISAVLRNPAIRDAIAAAATQTTNVSLPTPVPREVRVSIVALDPSLHDGAGILLVLSDRTRERNLERMRADFVANASHELRTPLASLIGFIDTLRGPAADDAPAQVRFLGIMAEQAERMKRLIDDLLSLSRIEMSEHQAPEARIDVGEIIPRVAAGFEPAITASKTTLEIAVDPTLPRIPADADQLAQVLQNLIENAVKYGRRGGTIRVSAEPAPPSHQWPDRPGILLAVADDGPGIPREHIPRLTERFYRVDKGRSRQAGGTGLGLAIVKHIINRHRGRLRIASTEGHGATFTIWLPS